MNNEEQAAGRRSTVHSSFVIERSYPVAPQAVFDAWADPKAKTQWFGPPQKPQGSYELDFRVGGREHLEIAMPEGELYSYDALYQDIVPGRRILYSYDMHRGDARISVSLAAVEIEADGDGAKLRLTEHGIYLDGQDTAEIREHGTNELIDAFGAFLLDGQR
jgi:uncharacterized protein YndB with AHSA1/START domain